MKEVTYVIIYIIIAILCFASMMFIGISDNDLLNKKTEVLCVDGNGNVNLDGFMCQQRSLTTPGYILILLLNIGFVIFIFSALLKLFKIVEVIL